jgi:hypothetical protein
MFEHALQMAHLMKVLFLSPFFLRIMAYWPCLSSSSTTLATHSIRMINLNILRKEKPGKNHTIKSGYIVNIISALETDKTTISVSIVVVEIKFDYLE